jgi:hypothetical protein
MVRAAEEIVALLLVSVAKATRKETRALLAEVQWPPNHQRQK